MDDANRPVPPPLTGIDAERVAAILFTIRKGHDKSLAELQADLPSFFKGESGALLPPKQPMTLCQKLSSYACELFDAEASHYPASDHLGAWLRQLATKVENMVVDHALNVGKSPVSFVALGRISLEYHAPQQQMRNAIRAVLENRIATFKPRTLRAQRPVEEPIEPVSGRMHYESDPTAREVVSPVATQSRPTVGQQIRQFRLESRMSIEELAGEVGIAPRNVRRHEAGETQVRTRNLGGYERVFSKRLKRPVRIVLEMPMPE